MIGESTLFNRAPEVCPHCSAPCVHVRASQGWALRLEPVKDGPWVIGEGEGADEYPIAYFVDGQGRALIHGSLPGRKVPASEQRYQSHFASCPRAYAWR